MSLKTKKMMKIFQPIEEQIKKLSELICGDSQDSAEMVSLRKLVLDQLKQLAEKFDNASKENADTYQDMKKKITIIIEEFCTIDFDKKDVEVKSPDDEKIFITLIEKFSCLLKSLEESEVIPLKQSLEECLYYVKDMGNVCEIEDFQNIKELGTSIADIFCLLQLYRKNLISNLLSEKLALFCCQLYMSFSMLVQLVKDQHQFDLPIYNCKKYVCERICFCIEGIVDILEAPVPSKEDESLEEENNFVYRLDIALDILDTMPSKTQDEQIKECDELWLDIEDIFAHAMSIIQVCQPSNFESVSGVCKTILTEFENLKTQLHSDPPDPTMNNLFINTLTDALYGLEHAINISVLTLVMEVFRDPYRALRKLIQTCGSSLSATKRSMHDLNSAIEEFDQLSDKSVQIGKFAIACCRDKNRGARIKNCLASLESLEMELIPAITAFYLQPDNNEKKACVKLLTDHWQQEKYKLQSTVYMIIDPAAYCEIVYDDIYFRTNSLQSQLDCREKIKESEVEEVIQKAVSVYQQINTTIEDIGQENVDKHTLMMVRELKLGVYEAHYASKKFLYKRNFFPTNSEKLRVLNRCHLFLKIMKKLIPKLSTLVNNSISMNTSSIRSAKGPEESMYSNHALSFPSSIQGLTLDQKTMTYIKTPYSIKRWRRPLTIQTENRVRKNESDSSVLIPYIERGRMMRTEWSVMYKTDKTPISHKSGAAQNTIRKRNLSNVRQHLFSRDSFLHGDEIDLTAETLDLTKILENLTGLSNTLNSTANMSTNARETPKKTCNSTDKMKNSNRTQMCKISKRLSECCLAGGDAPAKSSLEKAKKKRNKINVSFKL